MIRRALTLVETLAALVILSAVAAAAATSLGEASASARSSALRQGAAQALRMCPDLPRAIAGRDDSSEAPNAEWSRLVVTPDSRRWRVSVGWLEQPEEISAVALDGDLARVTVEVEEASGRWTLVEQFATPAPRGDDRRRSPRRRGSSSPRKWRERRPGRRIALTLVETLAALSILSMIAGMLGVWTSSTLRLQRSIALAGESEAATALRALRRDLDCAAIGSDGPAIEIMDDGALLEIVAPPLGAGLAPGAASAPAWRTAVWRVDRSSSALVRRELGGAGEERAWIVLRGVRQFTVEDVSSDSGEQSGSPREPLRLAIHIDWEDPELEHATLDWEESP